MWTLVYGISDAIFIGNFVYNHSSYDMVCLFFSFSYFFRFFSFSVKTKRNRFCFFLIVGCICSFWFVWFVCYILVRTVISPSTDSHSDLNNKFPWCEICCSNPYSHQHCEQHYLKIKETSTSSDLFYYYYYYFLCTKRKERKKRRKNTLVGNLMLKNKNHEQKPKNAGRRRKKNNAYQNKRQQQFNELKLTERKWNERIWQKAETESELFSSFFFLPSFGWGK